MKEKMGNSDLNGTFGIEEIKTALSSVAHSVIETDRNSLIKYLDEENNVEAEVIVDKAGDYVSIVSDETGKYAEALEEAVYGVEDLSLQKNKNIQGLEYF